MPATPPAIHTAPSASPAAPGAVHAAPIASPAAPGAVHEVPGQATHASLLITTNFENPALILEAVSSGAAGNDIEVLFVGWTDPSPTAPYYPPAVTGVAVTGNSITVSWRPTQYGVSAEAVAAALRASPEASALISAIPLSGTTLIGTFSDRGWPSTPTLLSGGGMSGPALPPVITP